VDVPESKVGLTHILNGAILRGGTEQYPPSELAMVLDEKAVRLSVNCGEEESVIRLSVLKEEWEAGMELLAEVLTRPTFDTQILESVKSQVLTALSRQGGNARAVSMRESKIWHFKGHVYGRDPLAGKGSIPTIDSGDLKSFLKKHVTPANIVAAVSGDIDKDQAIKGIETLFQHLSNGGSSERFLDKPPPTPPVIALIDKPGQVQSQIILRLPGILRTDPDYWKMVLLMNVFGGNDSLLNTRLRDDLGLVYSTWFYQASKLKAGMLIGYIGCRGDRTALAIRETIKIMDALRKDIPKSDLEQKRLDTLNSFIFNVDTAAALVETYGRYYLRGEPLDTLERIQDSLMDVSRSDLIKLAGKYFDKNRLQVFIVGDKSTRVRTESGFEKSLEQEIKDLADEYGLPYEEIPWR
jgi:zinc protease